MTPPLFNPSMASLKSNVRTILRALGVSLHRYDRSQDSDAVLQGLLRRLETSLILDIGANQGQYGLHVRNLGYRGKIVSFEPLSLAFSILQQRAASDPKWLLRQCALGERKGTQNLSISENTWSSSLLPILPRHVKIAPDARYAGTEMISVSTIDSELAELSNDDDNLFCKIDAQGYTHQILAGAKESLSRIAAIQVELSCVPLYEGEHLIDDILLTLYRSNFQLYHIWPELTDPETGQQLQVNGLLVQDRLLSQ